MSKLTDNLHALLVGKTVEVYRFGWRTAKVLSVNRDYTATLKFLADIGRHRVNVESLRGVYYRRRLVPLAEYIKKAAEAVETP